MRARPVAYAAWLLVLHLTVGMHHDQRQFNQNGMQNINLWMLVSRVSAERVDHSRLSLLMG
jgi:hypothetical protein